MLWLALVVPNLPLEALPSAAEGPRAVVGGDATIACIDRLRPLGIRFGLDDFGTGFSSFYYLKRFAVDYLKLGNDFVRDLQPGNESHLFIKAVNGIAGDLGLQVIVKGVESAETLKLLQDAGTLYVQGRLLQPVVQLDETATSHIRGASRA